MAETNLLSDPNFLSLLAGIGTRLDPQGAGGAIGVPTMQAIQAKAAQEALGKQEEQRRATNLLAMTALLPEGEQRTAYLNQAISMLGGMTPKGQPGVTGVKMTPTGGLNIDVDTPPVPQPEGIQDVRGEPELPKAIQPQSGGPTLSTAPRVQQRRISDIVPFY